MAHALRTIDDPDRAMQEINRQRAWKLALAVVAMIAALVVIAVGMAVAYSDAPDVRPGLQSY
jgi:anti-sigma-K factor RskA